MSSELRAALRSLADDAGEDFLVEVFRKADERGLDEETVLAVVTIIYTELLRLGRRLRTEAV